MEYMPTLLVPSSLPRENRIGHLVYSYITYYPLENKDGAQNGGRIATTRF